MYKFSYLLAYYLHRAQLYTIHFLTSCHMSTERSWTKSYCSNADNHNFHSLLPGL